MKIYIVGIVVAGENTFAKALSTNMEIPCFELDSIVYTQNTSGRYKEKLTTISDPREFKPD